MELKGAVASRLSRLRCGSPFFGDFCSVLRNSAVFTAFQRNGFGKGFSCVLYF